MLQSVACIAVLASAAAAPIPHASGPQPVHMQRQQEPAERALTSVSLNVHEDDSAAASMAYISGTPADGRDVQYVMKCMNGTPRTHACYFEGLLYDTQEHTFRFPWLTNAQEQLKGEGREELHVSQTGEREVEKIERLHLDFLKQTSPGSSFNIRDPFHISPSDTCTVSTPTHLRAPFRSGSFGHLLRDNMQALVEIAGNFGFQASKFRWTMWPDEAAPLSRVLKKYFEWMGGKPASLFSDVESECTQSNKGVLPRYLYFSSLLTSGVGSDWTREESEIVQKPASRKEPVCTDNHFKPLRTLAYSAYGLPHVPVPEHDNIRLTFLSKTSREFRHIVNMDELIGALAVSLPQVIVDVQAMKFVTPEDQMRILSRTSILVSSIGSASFRQIYLPDGAEVILIGALESPFLGDDGVEHRIPAPFREVDRCWGDLHYYHTLRYHVTHEKDIVRHAGRPRSSAEDAAKIEVQRVWDANVTVDATRFVHLVSLAVQAIEGKTADGSNTEIRMTP